MGLKEYQEAFEPNPLTQEEKNRLHEKSEAKKKYDEINAMRIRRRRYAEVSLPIFQSWMQGINPDAIKKAVDFSWMVAEFMIDKEDHLCAQDEIEQENTNAQG